jgi:hypothetical protein
MKTLFTLLIFFAFKNSFAQLDKNQFGFRFISQLDFQKSDFKSLNFPYDIKEHKRTTANFGIDILFDKVSRNRNSSIYYGLGYYREKFNFSRIYNHFLLNIGNDSSSIGTSTQNYIYSNIRLPFGVEIELKSSEKYKIKFGIENVINFSFMQKYNGSIPFPNANTTYSKLKLNNNSILIFLDANFKTSSNSYFSIIPFIRLSSFKKQNDLILFESNNKLKVNFFDAIGLSLKYSLTKKLLK